VQSKLILELIWWAVTIVITTLIMLPIYNALGSEYPYYFPNIIFIVIFITLTRYIFLVKYTFFADVPLIKIVFIFLPIPIFFFCIDALYDFQRFLDEEGVISLLGHLHVDDQYALAKYVRYQKIFFGTGAIITLAMLPIRMIISLWRRKNRGTY
jgi:hypothetical protein